MFRNSLKNVVKLKTGTACDPMHQEARARTQHQRGIASETPNDTRKLEGRRTRRALCCFWYKSTYDSIQLTSEPQ